MSPSPNFRIRSSALTLALALFTMASCSGNDADRLGTNSSAAADASNASGTSLSSTGGCVTSALFDSSSVHSIAVEFDVDNYAAMIAAYTAAGDKEWIEATVTIDGETYERVGLRLKGNSSLRSVDADSDPANLPWLVRLDKFVDDQTHDGVRDVVVRSNSSETAINEAVALELLEAAGLASQDAIATRFSVNGSTEVLRLVIELPGDEWMEQRFSATGALYKADSAGDYSYRGDDPEAYNDVFEQEAGEDNADLTPLIEFLEFINESDDETFAAELSDHLDVDSFATYLAMQDLLGNFDDIDGPGNNSYLFYDTDTEQFTIVPWDYNLSFGVGPLRRPGFDPGEMPEGFDPGEMPEGFDPREMPEGFPGGAGPGGGMPVGGSNVLVERFLENAKFNALYEAKIEDLTTGLIESGVAQEVLDRWVELLEEEAADLVDTSTIASEAAQIETQLSAS